MSALSRTPISGGSASSTLPDLPLLSPSDCTYHQIVKYFTVSIPSHLSLPPHWSTSLSLETFWCTNAVQEACFNIQLHFLLCCGLSCKIWVSPIQHKTCTASQKQNKDVLMVILLPSSEITALLTNRPGLFAYKKKKKAQPFRWNSCTTYSPHLPVPPLNTEML